MRPIRFTVALRLALGSAALLTACHNTARSTATSSAINPERAAPQTLGFPATGPAAPATQGTEIALPTGRRATSLLLLERIAPVEAAVGVPFQFDLRVTNLSDQVLEYIVVHDELPPTLQVTTAATLGEPGRGPEAFRIVNLPPIGPASETFGYVPPIGPAPESNPPPQAQPSPSVTTTLVPPAEQPSVHQPAPLPPTAGPTPLLPYQSQPQRQPNLLSPTAPPVLPNTNEPPPRPAPPPGVSTTAAPQPLLERRFNIPPEQQALAYVGPAPGSHEPPQPLPRAGEWVVGRLNPGEVRTLRVTATATAPGPLSSCVTATFQPALCGSMPIRPANPAPAR